MTEEMAESQSVWHMKIKASPLLHGGGLHVGNVRKMTLFTMPVTERQDTN